MSTTSPCCWCDPLPCRQALDRSQSQSKLRCSPCIGKKLATDPGILLSFLPSEKPQKRRKRSHTNVSNTLVARPSTPPAQTPQRLFQGAAAGTHLPSPTGSHTAAYTAKHGAFWMGGGITTLGAFCAVRKPCAAGCQNGVLCRFWVLVRCAPGERREPSERRCAHARRCSEASRPRWAA